MTLRHSLLAEPMAQFLAHHRALGKRFDTEAAALQLLDAICSSSRSRPSMP